MYAVSSYSQVLDNLMQIRLIVDKGEEALVVTGIHNVFIHIMKEGMIQTLQMPRSSLPDSEG